MFIYFAFAADCTYLSLNDGYGSINFHQTTQYLKHFCDKHIPITSRNSLPIHI